MYLKREKIYVKIKVKKTKKKEKRSLIKDLANEILDIECNS